MQNEENRVMAGIVTYNPSLQRLGKCVSSIINQVDEILIVDNASKNIESVRCSFQNDKCIIITNEDNLGIAKALNQIMTYACENNYKWVLTLDHDSIVAPDYMNIARTYMDIKNIGMISPQVLEDKIGGFLDNKTNAKGNSKGNDNCYELNRCITSGAITNVEAFIKTGGFDDDLFIDYVDFDYSMKVRKCGYKIIRVMEMYIHHELGESEMHRILSKKIRFTEHNVLREFYIGRNTVIYIKRYWKDINVYRDVGSLFKNLLRIIVFDKKEKKNKIKAYFKGIVIGLKT